MKTFSRIFFVVLNLTMIAMLCWAWLDKGENMTAQTPGSSASHTQIR